VYARFAEMKLSGLSFKSIWSGIVKSAMSKEWNWTFTTNTGWTGYTKPPMARNFKDEEIKGLNPRLVNMLDMAREYAGVPFVITSGYRDPEHNAAVGGVGSSAHTMGLGVDIRAPNDEIGKRVAFGLGAAGFKRVGFYEKHIHADIDETKPQVTWNGEYKATA
jgi:zinc D-Ala-D-Ala carboxypeptidase